MTLLSRTALAAAAAAAAAAALGGYLALRPASALEPRLAIGDPGGRQAVEKRFEGEFGLYVRVVAGGLEVRWLTEEAEEGVVRARVDGRTVVEKETAASDAHAAILPVEAPVVTLEYGGRESRRTFRTRIVRDPAGETPVDLDPPDSIYLFGDVHGRFDRITTLLGGAGLIDDELRWSGGTATVAFLGDMFDRGPDVTGVLWLLYRLEREAAEAGGRVLVVLGNHELMIMSGDLRYVHAGEASIGFRHRVRYEDLFSPTQSVLGRWLASKPGLVRLGDLLLAHGGMSPKYVGYALPEFQDTLRAFIAESLLVSWNDPEFLRRFAETTALDSAAVERRWDFFFGRQSVLWYRDLVLTDTLGAFLDSALERYDASVHIVAHTPVETIHQRYAGDLIAVDLLDAASEMLLLVREDGGGWARYKIPLEGEPMPLGAAAARPDGSG